MWVATSQIKYDKIISNSSFPKNSKFPSSNPGSPHLAGRGAFGLARAVEQEAGLAPGGFFPPVGSITKKGKPDWLIDIAIDDIFILGFIIYITYIFVFFLRFCLLPCRNFRSLELSYKTFATLKDFIRSATAPEIWECLALSRSALFRLSLGNWPKNQNQRFPEGVYTRYYEIRN